MSCSTKDQGCPSIDWAEATAESSRVDAGALRHAMSLYPTGVTIVTAASDGDLCGMVANSFTSVSLSPPVVAVCLQRGARTCDAAKQAGRFAIHITHRGQMESVRAFVGHDAPRFTVTSHDLDDRGTPILRDWLALLVLQLYGSVVVGDHELLLGLVQRCKTRPGGPLLFHRSSLRVLPELPPLRVTHDSALSQVSLELTDALVRILPAEEHAGRRGWPRDPGHTSAGSGPKMRTSDES